MASHPEPPLKPLPAPWDRIFRIGTLTFVWGSIAAIIYILRAFFLLVFLTFVFAYIQAHGVDKLSRWIASRMVRVVLVFLLFTGILTGTGFFVVPHIQDQAVNLAKNYKTYLGNLDDTFKDVATDWGVPIPADFSTEQGISALLNTGEGDSVAGSQPGEGGDAIEGKRSLDSVLAILQNIGMPLIAIGSAFFLSLLFSFLIVLDLKKLTRATQALAKTKIGWIYNEVAESVQHFGTMLGRALEAQFLIALVNTALTSVGLAILGIPNIVVLATIVFFCSFIPVAGVFISSTPICLVALQTSGPEMMLSGPGLMLACIILILVVHFVETYFLNPNIYGHHLRMNPVLVLAILTVGGKIFGIWGLVLGLPMMNYIFAHAIRYRPGESLPAPAQE
jgi:predicted PurR-regulated permease PerM